MAGLQSGYRVRILMGKSPKSLTVFDGRRSIDWPPSEDLGHKENLGHFHIQNDIFLSLEVLSERPDSTCIGGV